MITIHRKLISVDKALFSPDQLPKIKRKNARPKHLTQSHHSENPVAQKTNANSLLIAVS
jgi:hypothetical protein